MEQPVANKDAMTTKLAGNGGSSKKESLPPKAAPACSHSFAECLLCARPVVNRHKPDRGGSS